MKADTTILGDRETIELLAAQPELLAIADAVRATQRSETRGWRPHPRLLAAAAAFAGLAVMAALTFTGAFGGHPTSRGLGYRTPDLPKLPPALREPPRPALVPCTIHDCGAHAPTFGPTADLFDYTITRTDGAISSIAVTVFGTVVDTTAHLEVRMWGAESSGAGRVVFAKQVSLNSIHPPARWGAVSEWSGTLSPSDWDGGCQDAAYWLAIREPNPGGGITEIQPPPFNCQRLAVGPTGQVGPTGG